MSFRHLVILTPSAGGRVSDGYADTFARLTLECFRRGIKLSRERNSEPGHLVHARNALYASALYVGATDALWLDADIAFDPDLLFEMWDRPEDMIVRTYPARSTDWGRMAAFVWDHGAGAQTERLAAERLYAAAMRWTATLRFDGGAPVWSEDRALVELASCGFGWVLMKVPAMRDFYLDADWASPKIDWRGRSVACGLFDFFGGTVDQPMACEDVSFCERWRAAGRRIWCAPMGRVVNGDRVGVFADYLRQEFG